MKHLWIVVASLILIPIASAADDLAACKVALQVALSKDRVFTNFGSIGVTNSNGRMRPNWQKRQERFIEALGRRKTGSGGVITSDAHMLAIAANPHHAAQREATFYLQGSISDRVCAQIAETAKRVRALEADASSNTFLAVLARADQALGEIQAMNSVTKHDWAQKLGDLLAAIR